MRKAVIAALCIAAILLLTFFLLTQSGPDRDRVIDVSCDDAEMAAAIAKARQTLPQLLEAIVIGVDSYSVQVPVTDSNGTEHFWLSKVTFSDGVFSGRIDNDPDTVKTVILGQQYSIKKDAISDWLYVRGGKVSGNYTLRVLLPRMSANEAAQAKRDMGWE